MDTAANTGHTKLFRLTLCSLLRNTCLHLLQLSGFRGHLNRLSNGRLWRCWALGALHVNCALNGLELSFGGFGFVALVPCLC